MSDKKANPTVEVAAKQYLTTVNISAKDINEYLLVNGKTINNGLQDIVCNILSPRVTSLTQLKYLEVIQDKLDELESFGKPEDSFEVYQTLPESGKPHLIRKYSRKNLVKYFRDYLEFQKARESLESLAEVNNDIVYPESKSRSKKTSKVIELA